MKPSGLETSSQTNGFLPGKMSEVPSVQSMHVRRGRERRISVRVSLRGARTDGYVVRVRAELVTAVAAFAGNDVARDLRARARRVYRRCEADDLAEW
jgi:hypothetical protein